MLKIPSSFFVKLFWAVVSLSCNFFYQFKNYKKIAKDTFSVVVKCLLIIITAFNQNTVSLPTNSYEIPPKATIAEFECAITSEEEDGSITFSQPNKLGFKCKVTLDEGYDKDSDHWVAVRLKHDYIDTLNQKSEPIWLTHTVFINLKK